MTMNLKTNKMKITFFMTSILLLTSCGGWANKTDVEDAKKELLWDNYNASQNSTTPDTKPEEKPEVKTPVQEEKETKNFITLNSLPEVDSSTEEVKITGNVEEWVDKIVVKFTNPTSNFPDDEFELKKFKARDSSFEYNAYKRFQVLDTGTNHYEVIAYKWSDSESTKFTIEIPKKEEVETPVSVVEEESNISTEWFGTEDDYLAINLPENDDIWNVLKLSNTAFTYSKIEDFEVTKLNKTLDIDCEGDKLTSHLIDTYGWTYWNTCRPLNKEDDSKWISYFVLRLSGNKYFYEKHYYDAIHKLLWIKILETWTGVDKNNIWDKNKEFKAKDFKRDIIGSDEVFEIITK